MNEICPVYTYYVSVTYTTEYLQYPVNTTYNSVLKH